MVDNNKLEAFIQGPVPERPIIDERREQQLIALIGRVEELERKVKVSEEYNDVLKNIILSSKDSLGNLRIDGKLLVDVTDTEALLVRKNADGGDVFIVDTTNSEIELRGQPLIYQKADDTGIVIYGYDDMVAETLEIDIDSSGNGRVEATNHLTFKSTGGNVLMVGEIVAMRLGDNAGVDSFIVYDVDFGEVASINSNGHALFADVLFTSGGGLAFAEIYAASVADELTIGGIGVANKVQVTSFDTNGVSNNMTPNHTNDHITVTKAGIYLCTVSLHVESAGGGGADNFGFSVYKNDGATEFTNTHAHRKLAGGGGDIGSASLSGIIGLAVDDTIELWCWNEDSTDNLVIDDVTMSLVMVGGT